MKQLLTLTLLLIFVKSYTQDQLTNFESPTLAIRHILKNVDGQNYVITIDKLDSIKVFKVIGPETVFLHSHKITNLYSEFYLLYYERYILTKSINGSLVYNFVENTEFLIPYIDDLKFGNWRGTSGNRAILSRYNNNSEQKRTYLVDLSNSSYNELSSDRYYFAYDVTDTTLFYSDYQANDSLPTHYRKNLVTQAIDTIATGEIGFNYTVTNSSFAYILEKELFEYTFSIKSTRKIGDLAAINNVRIFEHDNEYICTSTNSKTYIYRFDKLTLLRTIDSLKQSYKFKPIKKIVDNKIVLSDWSNLIIYNLVSKNVTSYHTHSDSPKDFIILDERFLIHRLGPYVNLIDINTLEETTILSELPYGGSYKTVESIKNGSIHTINFESEYESEFKLIDVDIPNKKGMVSNILPSTNGGLVDESKIIELGSSILLLSPNDVHFVKDKSVLKLNKYPIVNITVGTYKINDKKLSWIEKSQDSLFSYSFQDGVKKLHLAISNTIDVPPYQLSFTNYFVGDKATYLLTLGFGQKLVKINHNDGVTTLLGEPKQLPSYEEFYSVSGNVYFFTSTGLKVELATGEIKSVNLDFQHLFLDKLYRFNDKMYAFAIDGFYELQGDQTKLIKSYQLSSNDFNYLVPFGEYGLILINELYYLFDGVKLDPFGIENINLAYLSNDIFGFNGGGSTTQNINKLYNFKTKQIFNIPQELENISIKKIFKNFDSYYVVGIQSFFQNYNVYIYKTDNDFSTFNKVHEFEGSGYPTSSFTSYNNEGMLFVGSDIYLMNDSLAFESIDNLAGESEAVQKDGYFYFIASHPGKGRQLYGLKAFSLRTSTNDYPTSTIVNVYPNPTSQNIQFDGRNYDVTDFTIFDIDGQLMKKGSYNGESIPVVEYPNGQYFIQFNDKTTKKSLISTFTVLK